MKVVEIFESINGESKRAGELAVFVRFKGCNLNCSYCDTTWANEADAKYTEMSVDEIVQKIKDSGIKNVTLTGGEPLLQKDIKSLVEQILSIDEMRVEIETNGSIDIDKDSWNVLPSFTLDYKSPSSGCNDKMFLDNLKSVDLNDVVKFVVGSAEDLDKAYEIITKYNLDKKTNVFLSPVFGNIEPVEIVDYMLDKKMNDVKIQIQMHKVIWDPNKRGV